MPRYKFSDFAYNINQKKMPEPGDEEMYIGLEHLDTGSLQVKRWGSDVPITGEKLVMKKGDILFGRRNTYLRRAAIAPHNGIFSAHGMIFRPNTELMDPDYFPFFISSDYFMNAAIRISVGSLSPTVNWKTLKDLEFDIPDLESQRKSAELLTAANDLKQSYEALLIQIDELVKSQFIEMFGLPELNTLNLTSLKLGEICDSITDGSHNPPKGIDGVSEYYMLSSKNIIEDRITLDDPRYLSKEQFESENKRTQIKAGDVLLTIVGTVGRSAVVPENHPCITLQRSVCVLHPKNDIVDSRFLCYELKCMQQFIDAQAQGAAQRGIYLAQVGKLDIVVPDMKRQKRFVRFLEQSDKSKFELKKAINDINELIKSLMQQDT